LGLGQYQIAVLKYDSAEQKYNFYKKFRFEKSTHGEGDIVHIERVLHMPVWFISCTFRSFKFFKVVEDDLKYNFDLPYNRRFFLKGAIKNCFMRISQINNLIIVISMGAVVVVKFDEELGG